jgi:hypothetical protein
MQAAGTNTINAFYLPALIVFFAVYPALRISRQV